MRRLKSNINFNSEEYDQQHIVLQEAAARQAALFVTCVVIVINYN